MSCDKSKCSSCSKGCSDSMKDFREPENEFSNIKKVIAVMSGKGGVGKSLVTSLLAVYFSKKGLKVGILDADITGPSIPKMFGVHGPAAACDDGIEPMLTANGIRLMSINLLLPDEESPVIWRGPVLGGVVEQFWNEDYYLWIRMAEHGAVMANTCTVLVNVRTGQDMYSRRGGKRYFRSELFLQNYMLQRKMISLPTYVDNIAKRWVVQRLLPTQLRGVVFRTFARKGK